MTIQKEAQLERMWSGEKERILFYPWLIGKDPDAGKDWRQKENSVAEEEMVR